MRCCGAALQSFLEFYVLRFVCFRREKSLAPDAWKDWTYGGGDCNRGDEAKVGIDLEIYANWHRPAWGVSESSDGRVCESNKCAYFEWNVCWYYGFTLVAGTVRWIELLVNGCETRAPYRSGHECFFEALGFHQSSGFRTLLI